MTSFSGDGDRAACARVPVEWFMPESRGRTSEAFLRRAARYCSGCEILDSCAVRGFSFEEFDRRGIWGGWLHYSTAHLAPKDLLAHFGMIGSVRHAPGDAPQERDAS